MFEQIEKVFSENPESDLWRELLQFTYEDNVKRYLVSNNNYADDKTISCIIGSFLQAYEYYKSAQNANLQISPLLLYYGSTNLLYGMANLFSGTINVIENHGMNLSIPEEFKFIADVSVGFFNHETGGIHVFARALGFNQELTRLGRWTLSEFLDSIAEINDDYKKCYDVPCGKIAMLDVFNTPDGKVEKVYYNENDSDEISVLLGQVEKFQKSYLNITRGEDIEKKQKYFILNHKLNWENIQEHSFSGQPYLRAAHEKNGQLVTIPTLFNMYIVLYALSSLCRYHPEKWSPFVLNDSSGEKLLIEKFLYYARRIIPNIVLNNILKKDIQYVSNKYQEVDTIKLVGEHQVQDIVRREVKKAISESNFRKEI